MTKTAAALDATLAGLAADLAPTKPVVPKGAKRLGLFLGGKTGKKWLASYRTPTGFLHVEVATLGIAATKEAAEVFADQAEEAAA